MPGIKVVNQPAASVDMTSAKILDPMIAFVLMKFTYRFGNETSYICQVQRLVLIDRCGMVRLLQGRMHTHDNSFQSLILGIARWQFAWIDLIWLAALVVATYFFGSMVRMVVPSGSCAGFSIPITQTENID